jgi:pyridoxal phosphate enzyme (YggS family)
VTSVDPALSVASVVAALDAVRTRIASAGGDPEQIAVLAVTKGFGAEVARVALAAGFRDLGENYAQELEAKAAELAAADPAPTWHFLGRLQTNKVRKLAPVVALWQSVDRDEVVDEIARRAPGAAILVQINLSGEAQKGGCEFARAGDLVARAVDAGLDVRGLMGVAPAGAPEAAGPGFRRLVTLADHLALPERSIGMSGDLEVAVEAGATMVRIGRDLFGERPTR